MSEQTSSKVPQVRFKGFEGDWVCKKLKDLTETGFTNGVFNDPSKVGRGYRLINVKDMFSGSYIDVDNLSLIDIGESEFKKNRVRYGDIFFTRSSLVKEGIACSNVNLSDSQNLTFDGHLIRMQPCKKTTDPVFLSYAFKTNSSRQQFIHGGKTTTMTTIGQSDIAAVEVALPLPTEQTQIGEYFRELDSLIGLHQRKHDKLVTLKKAMLQKMFPQPGATTPEIRFKRFEGDWEEKKLGESTVNVSNNTLSRANLNSRSGLAKNIHYGDILVKYGEVLDVQNDDVPFVSDDALANKLKHARLQDGDVVIADAAEDEMVGKCTEIQNVCDQVVLAGLHTIALRPLDAFAPYYLGYFLNADAFHDQLLRLMQGTKVLSISKTVIKETIVYFPTDLAEQKKIGTYFRTLDALIFQHATQLQKLQQIKSACLERMFV